MYFSFVYTLYHVMYHIASYNITLLTVVGRNIKLYIPFCTTGATISASGQGEFLKNRSVRLLKLQAGARYVHAAIRGRKVKSFLEVINASVRGCESPWPTHPWIWYTDANLLGARYSFIYAYGAA